MAASNSLFGSPLTEVTTTFGARRMELAGLDVGELPHATSATAPAVRPASARAARRAEKVGCDIGGRA